MPASKRGHICLIHDPSHLGTVDLRHMLLRRQHGMSELAIIGQKGASHGYRYLGARQEDFLVTGCLIQ